MFLVLNFPFTDGTNQFFFKYEFLGLYFLHVFKGCRVEYLLFLGIWTPQCKYFFEDKFITRFFEDKFITVDKWLKKNLPLLFCDTPPLEGIIFWKYTQHPTTIITLWTILNLFKSWMNFKKIYSFPRQNRSLYVTRTSQYGRV